MTEVVAGPDPGDGWTNPIVIFMERLTLMEAAGGNGKGLMADSGISEGADLQTADECVGCKL